MEMVRNRRSVKFTDEQVLDFTHCVNQVLGIAVKSRMIGYKTAFELTQPLITRKKNKRSPAWGGLLTLEFWLATAFDDPLAPGVMRKNPYRTWKGNFARDAKSYALTAAAQDAGFYTHREYAGWYDDPEIGNFYSEDFVEVWLVLIAHEVAHLINYSVNTNSKWSGDGHGDVWKETYRVLRKKVLRAYRRGLTLPSESDRVRIATRRR